MKSSVEWNLKRLYLPRIGGSGSKVKLEKSGERAVLLGNRRVGVAMGCEEILLTPTSKMREVS